MKKPIILSGALILLSFFLFSATLKKQPAPADPKPLIHYAGLQALAEPTGIAAVDEEQFNMLVDGRFLSAERVQPHYYKAIGPYVPDPDDPCKQDWIDFSNYMAANMAAFQAWANAHCRPYIGCWQGRCVAVLFMVRPTKLCWDPVYEAELKVFE